MKSPQWMQNFPISKENQEEWSLQGPLESRPPLLVWSLWSDLIPSDSYLDWAAGAYQLPILDLSFLQDEKARSEGLNTLGGNDMTKWPKGPWSLWLQPLAVWEGRCLIACVEPVDGLELQIPHQFVLMEPKALRSWAVELAASSNSSNSISSSSSSSSSSTNESSFDSLESLESLESHESFEAPDGIKLNIESAEPSFDFDFSALDGSSSSNAAPPPIEEKLEPAPEPELKPEQEPKLKQKVEPEPEQELVLTLDSEPNSPQPAAVQDEPPPLPSEVLEDFLTVEEPAEEVAASPLAPAPTSAPAPAQASAETPQTLTTPEGSFVLDFSEIPTQSPTIFTASTPPPPTGPTAPTPFNISSGITPASFAAAQNREQASLFAISMMQKIFARSLILQLQGDLLKPWRWTQPFPEAPVGPPPPIPLNEPCIFRIAVSTRLPYHGYIVRNAINDEFFKNWNKGKTPSHATLIPIVLKDQLWGLLMGFTDEKLDLRDSLYRMEALGKEVNEAFLRYAS